MESFVAADPQEYSYSLILRNHLLDSLYALGNSRSKTLVMNGSQKFEHLRGTLEILRAIDCLMEFPNDIASSNLRIARFHALKELRVAYADWNRYVNYWLMC